jgi:hypothetical protein
MIAIFPVSTKGGGNCFAFPDVCKTPAPPAPFVPIPYPNIAQVSQASSTSSKVKACKKDVVTKSSKINRSSGDEAGTLKGMVSQKNMDKVTFKKFSSKVKAEGKQVAHFTSMTQHNGAPNANMPAGAQIAPSQTKVLVAP